MGNQIQVLIGVGSEIGVGSTRRAYSMRDDCVRLCKWNSWGRGLLFNIGTGQWAEYREQDEVDEHPSGYGTEVGGELAAVYTKGGELFLSVGKERSCCSPGVDVRMTVQD